MIKLSIFIITLILSVNVIAQSITIQDYKVIYNPYNNSTDKLTILNINNDTLTTVRNAEICIKKVEEYCDCSINDNIKYLFYLLNRERYDTSLIFNNNK